LDWPDTEAVGRRLEIVFLFPFMAGSTCIYGKRHDEKTAQG
jgi:hypothetical protein